MHLYVTRGFIILRVNWLHPYPASGHYPIAMHTHVPLWGLPIYYVVRIHCAIMTTLSGENVHIQSPTNCEQRNTFPGNGLKRLQQNTQT